MAEQPEVLSEQPECSALVFAGYYLDTFLLNLLRLHYSDDPLQRFPGCRHLRYVPDIRSGGERDTPGSLRIDRWDQWNPSRTGSSPAIIVRRGPMGSTRIAIADKHQSPQGFNTGSESQFTRVWTGSVSLWCLSKVGKESELLGLQTADYIQGFTRQISQRLNIQRLEVRTVSDVKPLREQPTILATAVLVEYGFFLTWSTYTSAPRFNAIDLRTF